METVKIVYDTKGGDKGAAVVVDGVARALATFEPLTAVLVGDATWLAETCEQKGMPMDRVEILDAPDEITNYDSPAEALFRKPNASMLRALSALGERDDLFGMITAGNTGVLMAGSMRYLSGKERVRPALAAVLPAADGTFTCLVDTGATVDCTPAMLHHFARLGADLMKRMYAIPEPRIGLLSNGAEETKGNKLVKETHLLLKEDASLHFIGNVEGNTALSGVCDVLVCDGFAGNQVLKVTEGTATRIITDAVTYAKRTGSREIMGLVQHLMGVYDISSLGGGILLGGTKTVIKTRGSAEEKAVVNTTGMLLNMAANRAVFDQAQNHI